MEFNRFLSKLNESDEDDEWEYDEDNDEQETYDWNQVEDTIDSIASEARYKMDKWLPDDPEMQDDYFEGSDEDKYSILDEYIDEYFEMYIEKTEKAMDFISQHRSEIINKIINRD